MSGLTHDELVTDPRFADERWYHKIEFLPGVFSSGRERANLGVARHLLKGLKTEGMSCFDAGTMDGLMPLLLERQGARRVVAHDRFDRSPQIDLVKSFFDSDFTYLPGLSLAEVRPAVADLDVHPFDVVLCLGLLYHAMDPMAAIGHMRSLVRDGGIVAFETAAVVDEGFRMHMNVGARFFPATNYWMMSLDALEYCCRFFRMAPIDCAYRVGRMEPSTGLRICRISIVCRALDHVPHASDDAWLDRISNDGHMWDLDYEEILGPQSWSGLAVHGAADVPYEVQGAGLVPSSIPDSIDLFKTVSTTPPLNVVGSDHGMLLLNATD